MAARKSPRRKRGSGITPSPNDDTARYRREHALKVAKAQGRPVIPMRSVAGTAGNASRGLYARLTGTGLPGLKGK